MTITSLIGKVNMTLQPLKYEHLHLFICSF
jgi:hypothetical protein